MGVLVEGDVNDNVVAAAAASTTTAGTAAAYFFVRINRVQEEEGLGGVDHFGVLTARAIYDVEDSVTISMPSHCINHCRIAQDA